MGGVSKGKGLRMVTLNGERRMESREDEGIRRRREHRMNCCNVPLIRLAQRERGGVE